MRNKGFAVFGIVLLGAFAGGAAVAQDHARGWDQGHVVPHTLERCSKRVVVHTAAAIHSRGACSDVCDLQRIPMPPIRRGGRRWSQQPQY